MAASSSARLSDIRFSLVIGSPGVFRRSRQYIPAVGSELIAPALAASRTADAADSAVSAPCPCPCLPVSACARSHRRDTVRYTSVRNKLRKVTCEDPRARALAAVVLTTARRVAQITPHETKKEGNAHGYAKSLAHAEQPYNIS
jgi:hypothetical protein